MNDSQRRNTIRIKPVTVAVIAALSAISASAQESKVNAPLERVEITGSRIKGIDLESAVPIQTITRAQIEATGASTLEDVLMTLTENTEGNRSASGGGENAYANLRGAGAGRTLVLVNGHRWVGSSDLGGVVNLNSIPLAAVERVDVLKDGGSVLYGSDAMVGLINIILKDHYNGAQLSAGYGGYQRSASDSWKVNMSAGYSGERFDAWLALGLTDRDGAHNRDYGITSALRPIGAPLSARGSDSTPAGRFQTCKTATGPCTSSSKDLNGAITFDQPYNPNNFVNGKPVNNSRPYSNNDRYNNAGFGILQTQLNSKSAMMGLGYRITDHVRFKFTAAFNDSASVADGAPQELSLGLGGAAAGSKIFIAKDSYYNPTGLPIGKAQRTLLEAGPQASLSESKVYVFSPTLLGDFSVAGRNFDWEVGLVSGRNHSVVPRTNQISTTRLANALGSSFKDANGKIVCGAPGKVIAGCVPLNLLGAGAVTQPMLDYITLDPMAARITNDTHDRDMFAQISSPNVLALPAGNVGFAGGLERRSAHGHAGMGEAFYNNDVFSGGRSITDGEFSEKDVAGELFVPLLKDLPLIRKLDLTLAARYSKFDPGTGELNKKIGLKWDVTKDFALRGSYSTGYRFDTGSILVQTMDVDVSATANVDRCSYTTDTTGKVTANPYAALTPAQQATCQAQGVKPGGYDTRTASQTTHLHQNQNPDLGPETNVFRSVGLLYSPSYVPGLDLTLDYWDFIFSNTITRPVASTTGQATMLDRCLNSYGDPHACPTSWITRDATGAVSDIRISALNGPGGEHYQGFDLNLRYRPKATRWGKFSYTWGNTINYKVVDKAAPHADDNKVGFAARSRLRSNFSVDWSNQGWGARWTARYTSSFLEDCSSFSAQNYATIVCNALGDPLTVNASNGTATYVPFMDGGSANRISGYTQHDVSLFYSPTATNRIKVGINNAFNKQPSVSVTQGRNYYSTFGLPDRYFFVEYSQKF